MAPTGEIKSYDLALTLVDIKGLGIGESSDSFPSAPNEDNISTLIAGQLTVKVHK
jgi:hypothetical protein